MKITRIIEYEGEERDLLIQLGKSLPDGIKETSNVKISVITLNNMDVLEAYTYKKEEPDNESSPSTYTSETDDLF